MANFDTIKTTIDANINTNGNQAITGAVMNSILKQMVDSTDTELTELESRTDELSKDGIETYEDSIIIEDNNGNKVFHLDEKGLDAKNVKSNGKDVLTEHQDISEITQKVSSIERQANESGDTSVIITTDNDMPVSEMYAETMEDTEECQSWESDDYDKEKGIGEQYVKITSKGIYAKAFLDMNGSPIGELSILPDSYISHITSKAEKINNLMFQFSDASSVFFFTDTHYWSNHKRSTLLIKEVQKLVGTEKVFFGGDLVGTWKSSEGDVPFIEAEAYTQQINILDRVNYYPVRGNHDIWARVQSSTVINPERGYQTHQEEAGFTDYGYVIDVNSMIFKQHLGKDFVCADSGMYGYVDDDIKKIRYILIDTSNISKYFNGYGSNEEEMIWLLNNAFKTTKNGYAIVCFGHIPSLQAVKYSDHTNPQFLDLFAAINNKSVFSYKGVDYSFEGTTYKVIAYVNGHEHADNLAFKDGVIHFVTNCDTFDVSYKRYGTLYKQGLVPTYERLNDNPSEQVVDWIMFDAKNGYVRSVRLGAGYDRIAKLEPIKISVGQSVTIIPDIVANKWYSIDSDSPDEENPKREMCSVSNNGTVTANKTGQVTVYAIAADGTHEAFNVVIS